MDNFYEEILSDQSEELKMSYREIKDEDEILCKKCGKPLEMKRVKYIHRHDGANEAESYMAVDDSKMWELYDDKYHIDCISPKMDQNYGKVGENPVVCSLSSEKCEYIGENGYCLVAENEDVVVGCHLMR